MAHKLALVFAVVALLSVANAADAFSTNSPTTASFNATPVDVVNSTDTVYYSKVGKDSITFGAGADNTTNYMYGFVTPTVSGTTYPYSILRRKLNSTTQASIADETLTGASCDAATATVKAGGQGASALACVLSATSIANVWLYSWTATGLTAKATQISAETATTNKYAVDTWFYDDGAAMWYVIYRQYDVAAGTNTMKVNIQAVNVTNGTAAVVYAAGGVQVIAGGAAVTTASIGTVSASLNNVTSATTATIAYKDGTGSADLLKIIPVTLSSGSAGSAVTIGTDATTALDTTSTPNVAGHTVTNTLAGLGCSYSTYVAGVYQMEVNTATTAGATAATTKKVWIYFNGSSTSVENYTLGTTSDVTSTITATQFGSGFSIFQMNTATGTPNTATTVQYINYFGNGTANGSTTATSVGTYQGVKALWLDANGALWVGAANYEYTGTSSTVAQNLISDATVGKLFGQVYLFANTLSSVFAFVALMVAALFAF